MSSETEPTDTGNPNVIRGPHLKIPDPCLLPAWIDEFEELIVEGPKDLIVTNAPERNTLGCLKIRSGKRIKSEIPVSTLNPCPPSDTPVDKLSSLPMDIGALILANLFLEDIVNFSKVSKVQHHQTFNNEALWRIKFHQRWNCEHAGLLQSMHAVYSDIPPLSDHKSACNDDDGRGLEASRHISVQDPLEGGMNTFWKRCYQSAHSNPHDLWITHWNCVEPNDGVSSGRTVIPDLHLKPRRCVDLEKGPEEKYCSHKSNLHEGIMRQCPTCRHHPLLRERLEEIEHALNAELNYKESNGADTDSDPIFQTKCVAAAHQKLLEDSSKDKEIECITTPSRSIYSSTQYSLSKLSRRMDSVLNLDLQKPLHSSNASNKEGEGIGEFEFKKKLRERRNAVIQAFETASTFGRQLDCHQYRSSGLQFLTDTLFFPLDLSHERATFTSRDKMTNDEKVRTNPEVDTQVNLHQKSEEQSSCSYEFSETEHALFDLYGSPNFEMNIEYRPFDAFSDDSIVRPKDPGTLSSLGSKFETTQYSWHIIRLTNPDHVRPLSFRVFCQRSECFTAFPSQGYLRPGETCFITLGVSCLGGVMAKAVDEIDTMRDEVLPFLAEIYQREGDLPRTAFALRYIYAPCVPCVPIELQDFDGIVTNTESDDRNEQFGLESGITNRLWDNLRSEKEVRTIHLSAHVNGHYSLSEFQNRTMAPFELSQPLVKDMKARKNIVPPYVDRSVVAPNLEQSAPKTFSFLHDMALESDCSSIGISYRTEKSCMFCGRDWGARSEQLGRSFVLKKAVFEEHGRQHNRQMCNVYDALRSVTVLYNHSILNHDESENEYDARLLNRLYQLLLIIHTVLTKKRGCALSTERQKEVLTCYEIYEDQICLQLSRLLNKKTSEDNKIEIELLENHWRFSGIFKNPRCKNVDVFGNHESICLQRLFDPKFSLLKEEPGHLDEFRYKGHTPGLYQFGIPDDPNIPDGENNNQHTDLFHNKLFESLKSGIALVLDPKSLLTHGLYDFVPLPGTISRYYCRTDVSYFDVLNAIDNEKVKKTLSENIALWQEVALTRKKGKLLYFSDQKEAMFRLNDPDPDGYRLFTIGLRRSLSGGDNVLNSLFTYVNNIPSPGTGRYPLSKLQSDNPHVSINSIIVPYTPTDFNYGESSLEVKNEQQFISTGRGRHNLERRLPPFMLFGGLRLLNSFWYICEQVGWSIVDEDNPGLTMVNRRLLIATQVLSNSLVTFPLLLSLVARHISLISTHPIDHYLDGQVSCIMKFAPLEIIIHFSPLISFIGSSINP
jgi:hypothetical protein